MSEAFTAVAACPCCHLADVHRMRAPQPAPTADEMARWEREHERAEIQTWGSAGAVRVVEDPPRPVDESVYEVVRICAGCGHEWGMT